MAKGRWHPSYCYTCGKTREEVGRISATGACEACGRARMIRNLEELEAHSGEAFDHWLDRIRKAVLPLSPAEPRREP